MIITTDKNILTTTTKIDIEKVINFLRTEIKKTYDGNIPKNVYIAKVNKDFTALTGLKTNATYYTIKELMRLGIAERTEKKGCYLINTSKLFEK